MTADGVKGKVFIVWGAQKNTFRGVPTTPSPFLLFPLQFLVVLGDAPAFLVV